MPWLSPARPADYPLGDLRGTWVTAAGSGFVYKVQPVVVMFTHISKCVRVITKKVEKIKKIREKKQPVSTCRTFN